MTDFDYQPYLIEQSGKPYLEAKACIAWFRQDNPKGSLPTEVLNFDPLVIKASVFDGEGNLLATAHAYGLITSGKKAFEKVETSAVRRALSMAGYGTPLDAKLSQWGGQPQTYRSPAGKGMGNGDTRRVPLPPQDDPTLELVKKPPSAGKGQPVGSIYFQQTAKGKFSYVVRDISHKPIGVLYEGSLLRDVGIPVDDWKAEGTKAHILTSLLSVETETQADGTQKIVRFVIPQEEAGS